MLSLVFAYGWTALFLAAAVAAFVVLTPPFRAPVVGILLILVVADVGYTAGLSKGLREAHAASLAYQAKLDSRDLTISTTASQLAEALTAAQEAHNETDQKVALYEKQLSASRACPLSPGDRKRLLGIK